MDHQQELESVWGLKPCQKKVDFYTQNAVGKILDYGCGYGAYGSSLLAKDMDVSFADMDQKFMENIKVSPDKKFVVPIDGLPFADNTFDTILLGDVIEHVDNLEKFWLEVNRVVAKKILISVPRRETPGFFKPLAITWRAYEDLTHKRYFEKEDLEKLATEKFNQVEVLKYYPRTKLHFVFNTLESINYFPGFLAVFSSKPN